LTFDLSDARLRKPTTTSIVLDGAPIEQMLKPAACKNFREYAQEIFLACLQYSILHHVWAGCATPSSRAQHGKGVCGCVVAEAAMPINWQNFLQVDTHETHLFKFVRSYPVV
jgi:hypothetical protein